MFERYVVRTRFIVIRDDGCYNSSTVDEEEQTYKDLMIASSRFKDLSDAIDDMKLTMPGVGHVQVSLVRTWRSLKGCRLWRRSECQVWRTRVIRYEPETKAAIPDPLELRMRE